MKTSQAFLVLLTVAALGLAPLSAQRPGHGGGGRPSGGPSMSSGSRPSGGPSHSSGGFSSRPSSSSFGGRPSPSSSRPSGGYSSGTYNGHAPSKGSHGPSAGTHRPSAATSFAPRSHGGKDGYYHGTSRPSHTPATATRPSSVAHYGKHPVGGGRPAHAHGYGAPAPRPAGAPAYGRIGRPGPMPPAHRHIRPAPYFYHPIHHHHVHMRPIFWDPVPFHVHYWPGFWSYCYGYWHDYRVSDIVVVREYVREKYNTDLVTYVISGDYMYALAEDDGDVYLQVFDKGDNLLAQQKVSKKYCLMEVDKENGGCWIMKKNNKDPLLFLYNDGELLIYEED